MQSSAKFTTIVSLYGFQEIELDDSVPLWNSKELAMPKDTLARNNITHVLVMFVAKSVI